MVERFFVLFCAIFSAALIWSATGPPDAAQAAVQATQKQATVSLSVSVPSDDQAAINAPSASLADDHSRSVLALAFGLDPVFSASLSDTVDANPLLRSLFRFFQRPWVSALILSFFIATLLYSIFVLVHPTVQHVVYWQRHAQRYHVRKKLHTHHKLRHISAQRSHKLLAISTLLVIVKIAFVSFSASFLAQLPRETRATTGSDILPGGYLDYTLAYTNTGSEDLTDFTVMETFPAGTTLVADSFDSSAGSPDANDDTLTLTIPNLAAAETGTLTWQLVVDHPTTVSEISNAVIFSADGLAAAESNATVNTVAAQTISGKVFHDVDGDQFLDSISEAGLPDVALRLYTDDGDNTFDDGDDVLVTSETTDAGLYTFAGLRADTYFVKLQTATLPDDGYIATTDNPLTVALTARSSQSSQDFGYTLATQEQAADYSMGDFVWHDANRDRRYDADEDPLADIDMRLYIDVNDNAIFDTSDPYLEQTTTDDEGWYGFGDLEAGGYLVVPVEQTLPVGYTVTTGGAFYYHALGDGTTRVTTADFGYAVPTSIIGNEIFEDSNNNTLHDDSEAGLQRVPVFLYEDVNLTSAIETDVDVVAVKTFSNQFGVYSFEHVPVGRYLVWVDENMLPHDRYVRTTGANPWPVEIKTDTDQQYMLADFGYRDLDGATASGSANSSPATGVSSVPATTPVSTSLSSSAPADVAGMDATTSVSGSGGLAAPNPDDAATEDTVGITVVPPVAAVGEAAGSGGVSHKKISDREDAPKLVVTEINNQPDRVAQVFFPEDERVVVEGFATPNTAIVVQVFSDNPLTYTVQTDDEGKWQAEVDLLLLAAGYHHVRAQTVDASGQNSQSVLVAAFSVQVLDSGDLMVWIIMLTLLPLAVLVFFIVFRSQIFSHKTFPHGMDNPDRNIVSFGSHQKALRKKSRASSSHDAPAAGISPLKEKRQSQ